MSTAVVTGASGGIGAAVVRALAADGADVVALDVSWDRVEGGDLPDTVRTHTCDVADPDAVAAVFAELETVDVLVNVAGVVLVKPFADTTWDDYRRTIDVNLGGTIVCCRHAAAKMTGGGAIVNVASISGHIGQPQHAVYAASKGAVLALCRALAWELAPRGIRVNSVSPGSVDTPMLRSDIDIEARRLGLPFDEVKADREAEQSIGRWARPEEIASAVAFLAGPGASFVNGADLLVDSGWVAK